MLFGHQNIQGMYVVPWEHGFSADIETCRSRQRRKVEQEEKMCALEERVASIEGATATSQQQQLEARSTAHLESSPTFSKHRSSIACMEDPAADRAETVAVHYPMDDITMRTSCELLYQ
jgi:hypothetical protein